MDKSEAKEKAGPLVCSYCKDVSLYCKCAVENPLCETCLFVLTECVCPGATRKPRDFWEGAIEITDAAPDSSDAGIH